MPEGSSPTRTVAIGDEGSSQLMAVGRVDTERADKPLLVCLHGGGYDSGYFDIDGHSLLKDAADHGFNAIALDRPGYGASVVPAGGQPSLAESAQMISVALQSLWEDYESTCPGIVLIGHSIGGAIAIHLAASPQGWPLLGVSISGLGHIHVIPTGPWDGAPPDSTVEMPSDVRRMLLWGPDWTLQSAFTDRYAAADRPAPVAELVEIKHSWPHDFAGLAARVRVPVQFAAAEFDTIWKVAPEAVAEFAAGFTAAPFVVGSQYRAVGHCIDQHALGYAWHLEQFAFTLRCAMERSRPQVPGGEGVQD
jgi:pimeloyl-ACP methyl ester carboxylesterase